MSLVCGARLVGKYVGKFSCVGFASCKRGAPNISSIELCESASCWSFTRHQVIGDIKLLPDIELNMQSRMGLAIAWEIGMRGSVMAQFARVPQWFSGYTRFAPLHVPSQQSDVTSIGKDSLTRNVYGFAASLTPLVASCFGVGCA